MKFAGDRKQSISEACVGTLRFCFMEPYPTRPYPQLPAKERDDIISQCLQERGVDMATLETKPVDRHWWDFGALQDGKQALTDAHFTYMRSAPLRLLQRNGSAPVFDPLVMKTFYDLKNNADKFPAHLEYVNKALQDIEQGMSAKVKENGETLRRNASETVKKAIESFKRTFRPEFQVAVQKEIERMHQCFQKGLFEETPDPLLQVKAPDEIIKLFKSASAFSLRSSLLEKAAGGVDTRVLRRVADWNLEVAWSKAKGLKEFPLLEEDMLRALEKRRYWTGLSDGDECRMETGFTRWLRTNGEEWSPWQF
ncbi:hypothetical protein CDD81_676 [Ophiocordyceps australis]|uniref:Uncharacterized protein n=1 Tax=Ophiocordyceps australis TaxID=1399860 RepID=A0A2C5XV95_9HYPO|nr:hypothetical protein CDD81_676 [Ophiocordyceps australis]